MTPLKEILEKMMDDMKERRERASRSLESGFDIYSEGKIDCGEEREACVECLEEHGGLCIAREAMKDAFMSGASCFLLAIEEAGKTGVPGAMTEKVSKLSEELSAYGKKMISIKITNALFNFISGGEKGPIN